MLRTFEVAEILQEKGIEFSMSDLREACGTCESIEQAVARFSKQAEEVPSDLDEYMEYNRAMKQVHFWLKFRAEIGETDSAEDIAITSDDRSEGIALANVRIGEYIDRAKAHLEGAKRHARSCRIELEEISPYWLL